MTATTTGRPLDLASLAAPGGWAVGRDEVRTHGVEVPVRWWRERLLAAELPELFRGADDRRVVTRADVWELAADAAAPGGVLRLLWASVAWGSGPVPRLGEKRIAAAREVPGLEATLRRAASFAAADPLEAYRTLHTPGRAAMKYLGPAFGTKFLYFAGGGRPEHLSQILDSRVIATLSGALRAAGCDARGDWGPRSYEAYCTLLQRWTREFGLESADQWELALFRNAPASVGQ